MVCSFRRFFLLLLAISASATAFAVEPFPAAEGPGTLHDFALRAGLTGDDLSPALALSRTPGAPASLRQRPDEDLFTQFASASPALRVHLSQGLFSRLPDRNGDGVPDRAAAALRVARETLAFCRRAGLGAPIDDGDGELDLFLEDLGAEVRGFAVEERAVAPGRGVFGFAVVDASPLQSEADFRGMVARTVARLVLAGRDASAPAWWREPSALWIQARVSGPPLELERALIARWNHPEVGLLSSDPVLARGNVGLLWSLGDEESERQALEEVWRALAQRDDDDSPVEVIDRTLQRTLGLDLLDLQARAGIAQLADGYEPARLAHEIGRLPVMGETNRLPVSPGGLAVVLIRPDPDQPDSTDLTILAADELWRAALLAHRRDEGWEQGRLVYSAPEGGFELSIPWRDYDRIYLLFSRPLEGSSPGQLTFAAQPSATDGPFALSSLSARRISPSMVEIRWSSAWEQYLFGWTVERAPGPEGPWTVVQEIALPALGFPEEGGAYLVQDPLPAGASPAFYRIVGLTRQGLRASGPVVATAPSGSGG